MSAKSNRALKNPLTRKVCRWCEGKFMPKKSDTETTCSVDCAAASLGSRDLTPAAREAIRQVYVDARQRRDAELTARLSRARANKGAGT